MKEKRSRVIPLKSVPHRYSTAQDFLKLVLLLVTFSFVFYKFIYLPVFNENNAFQGKIKCKYFIQKKNSNTSKESYLIVETNNNNFLVEKKDGFNIVKDVLFDDKFFVYKQGKLWLYERSLNPYYIPYSGSFGSFILDNGSQLKNFINHGEIYYLNRNCLKLTFGDWLVPDKRYEVIIDKETCFPLFLRIVDSKRTILRAKAESFSLTNEKSLSFKKQSKFIDVYSSNRLEPAEVQAVADFDVLVPSYIPVQLNTNRILYLKEYTPPLSPLKFVGKLIMFNYFGNGEFANILEYKGSFPVAVKNGVYKLKIGSEKYNMITCPGYYIVWKTKDGVTIAMFSNLTKSEIIKIIEGLSD